MLGLYIPKSEIVILRTAHLDELRTSGRNGVENKRIFDWLSDDTLETIVHKFVTKMGTRKKKCVIKCTYNGTPLYILGSLRKFHGKFAFTVISTIKSESAINPYKDVDTFHRFNFKTDLNTFTTIFNKLEHDEKIEKLIRETHFKKMENLSINEKMKIVMDRLEQRVERRVEKEKTTKEKELKIQTLYNKVLNTPPLLVETNGITSKRVRTYRYGIKKQYKENGQYDYIT